LVRRATGVRGDGSRERPFHDPWAAFRRAEPGDTIHIAAGTYYGRLDRSSWIVECPRITVLGRLLARLRDANAVEDALRLRRLVGLRVRAREQPDRRA